MKDLKEFQKTIGYEFRDESLLRQALTHSSYANEHHMKKLSDLPPESQSILIRMNIDQCPVEIENISVIAFHVKLSLSATLSRSLRHR